MEPVQRRAARVLVLDPQGRVLLARYRRPNGEGYWATLGGGVDEEENEGFEATARRELEEEVGIVADRLEPAWTGEARYVFGGRPVVQEEHFFVYRAPSAELPAGLESARMQEGILEVRWWTLDELVTTGQTVYPPDLERELRRWLSAAKPQPGGPRPDPTAHLPDVRDGLTRRERAVLTVLAELQAEHPGRAVPLAQLYGRVLEHEDLSVAELQTILLRMGCGSSVLS